MTYSCSEKELWPSLLVGRLSERSCDFLSTVSKFASNRIPCRQSADDGKSKTTKPPNTKHRTHGPYCQNTLSVESSRESQGCQHQTRTSWLAV